MKKNNIKIDIEQLSVNQAKGLIMDMVRGADSGHTGGPFSSIDFAYVLYKDFLKFDPDDPNWFNRDRFVLSAGHESALLYAMLHYVGWLSIEDLKEFRKMGSKTPGHPERGVTPGVEATTGPLGQGVGNAVGLAAAESVLRNQFGNDIVNHFTYFLHSDGDIQEPVAMGSVAIAGHWGLSKLIGYYDANKAQISGEVNRSDSVDYVKFYESNNWHVQEVDGQNRDQIRNAIRYAQMEVEKPSIIIGHNVIAPGCATMEGDHNTHGAPLPPEEIKNTKINLGLDYNKFYYVSQSVLSDFRESFHYARTEVEAWNTALKNKLSKDKNFSTDWNICINNADARINWPKYDFGENIATRKVWGAVIEAMAPKIKTLVGGSADLEPSNVTTGFAEMVKDFNKNNQKGRNFAYGVREFPMGAINNGIAQHGGLKVFGASFFVFSDYERPAIRMRALQKLPVITEYTHDSIFVGEDGPTHQPIEQLMSCRSIPNLLVMRPCDANEAVVASRIAFEQTKYPSLILLSRQGLPVLNRNIYTDENEFRKGAYILADYSNNNKTKISIFCSGSEVSLSIDVMKQLNNFDVRIVNFGCWELFEMQDKDYKENIIFDSSYKVSIEAGITDGWQKYTSNKGLNIGIDRYGESAPGKEVAESLGLSVELITKKIIQFFKEK